MRASRARGRARVIGSGSADVSKGGRLTWMGKTDSWQFLRDAERDDQVLRQGHPERSRGEEEKRNVEAKECHRVDG